MGGELVILIITVLALGCGGELTVKLPGGVSMEFVYIEPGSFMMGSDESEMGQMDERERPQHEVEISRGFYLGKYEITQGQWYAVMETRPWKAKRYVREGADHPAVYISWMEVQKFIQRLNRVEGERVYRLATEAEWEYACRAGTRTLWSCGDDEMQLRDYAWISDNSWMVGEQYAHAVGGKLPNPWGLYDMHGNVWEWVWDREGVYGRERQIDPKGPDQGALRVARSGSFGHLALGARSASRFFGKPDSQRSDLGARLVRQIP